jgi:hypothetical protein
MVRTANRGNCFVPAAAAPAAANLCGLTPNTPNNNATELNAIITQDGTTNWDITSDEAVCTAAAADAASDAAAADADDKAS